MAVVPGTLNYHDPNSPDLMKSNVIIAGRGGVLQNPFYQTLQATGRRIVQYVDWVDIWPAGTFDKKFCTGLTALPGGITNWGGKPVIDYADPANLVIVKEAMKYTLSLPEVDDVMCDVFGTRLWSGAWTAMTTAQKSAYAAGARLYADALGAIRDQYRPSARLYANGSWNGEGNKNVCPAVENHDSEIDGGFWQGYLKLPWDTSGQACGIVYTKSLAAAQKWATVPGVGVVCIHPTDYYGPSGLAIPYATLTPRSGVAPPPPPPPPPPDDPCATVKADLLATQNQLAASAAALAAARNNLADREALLAAANDKLLQVRTIVN